MNPPWRLEGLKPSQWFGIAFLLKRDPGLCTAPATGTRGEQRPLRGPQGEAWFPVRGFLEGAPVVRHIEKQIQEIQPSNLRFKLWVAGLSPGVFEMFREGFRGFDSVHHFLKRISGMRYLGTNGVSLRSKRCRVVWSTRTWMACCLALALTPGIPVFLRLKLCHTDHWIWNLEGWGSWFLDEIHDSFSYSRIPGSRFACLQICMSYIFIVLSYSHWFFNPHHVDVASLEWPPSPHASPLSTSTQRRGRTRCLVRGLDMDWLIWNTQTISNHLFWLVCSAWKSAGNYLHQVQGSAKFNSWLSWPFLDCYVLTGMTIYSNSELSICKLHMSCVKISHFWDKACCEAASRWTPDNTMTL